MTNQYPHRLEYAPPSRSAPPRRAWLPVTFLFAAAAVWYWPRLTPTYFPTVLDQAMLVLLPLGAVLMAAYSSVPRWAFTAFGAGGVLLFLFANFNDNNFRANTNARSIVVPWCAMVVGGALVSRMIAVVGRKSAELLRATGERPRPLPGRGKGMLTVISEDDDHLKDFTE